MSRADGLHRVALALADYLSRECRADPNPSGHSAPPRPRNIVDSEPAPEEPPPDSDGGTPALVPDVDYTVTDAMKITHFAESTLRKMMSKGRLPFRKKGSRSLISGRHLAAMMAKQLSRSTDPADED